MPTRPPLAALACLAFGLITPDRARGAAPANARGVDSYGDPLPAGAAARAGTVRFRHASSAIAYSPDGKLLASGGHDNQVRLFDASTGKEVRRLAGHRPRTYKPESDPGGLLDTLLSAVGQGCVCSVAFSPDGKTLASGGWDDYVRLWDVATGKQLRKIDAHRAMVARVAFSPDGKFLASRGGLDGTAKLWDPTTGTLLQKFTGLSKINPWRFNHDSALAFSPDGKTVAVTARKQIVLYEVATGQEVRRVDAHVYGICLAYSPNGKVLASGGVDAGKDVYSLRLWDAHGGKQLRTCKLPKNEPPTYLAFPPKRSDRLAAVVAEDYAHVFDVATGKPVADIRHYWPSRIAYSPDGKTLTTAGSGPVVRQWDSSTGKERFTEYAGHRSGISAVALSPDGKLVASGGEDIRLWDRATGRPEKTIPVRGGAAALAFSPDGRTLASAGRDRLVHLWDVQSGKPVKEWKGHRNALCAVAFSPDGKTLASGDVQATVRLWDVKTGKQLHVIDNKSGTEALSLAFSPGGKTLACAGAWNDSSFLPKPGAVIKINGKEVKLSGSITIQGVEMTRKEGYFVLLWDVASGKEVRRFGGLTDKLRSVTFAPGGKVLAAASSDGRVCFWDAASGKERLFILAHPGHADSPSRTAPAVAFLGDGRTLVSAGADGTVRVWDATTGKERGPYRAPGGGFSCLAVGRDGKTVVTGSADGTVLVWDVTLPVPAPRRGRHVITLR